MVTSEYIWFPCTKLEKESLGFMEDRPPNVCLTLVTMCKHRAYLRISYVRLVPSANAYIGLYLSVRWMLVCAHCAYKPTYMFFWVSFSLAFTLRDCYTWRSVNVLMHGAVYVCDFEKKKRQGRIFGPLAQKPDVQVANRNKHPRRSLFSDEPVWSVDTCWAYKWHADKQNRCSTSNFLCSFEVACFWMSPCDQWIHVAHTNILSCCQDHGHSHIPVSPKCDVQQRSYSLHGNRLVTWSTHVVACMCLNMSIQVIQHLSVVALREFDACDVLWFGVVETCSSSTGQRRDIAIRTFSPLPPWRRCAVRSDLDVALDTLFFWPFPRSLLSVRNILSVSWLSFLPLDHFREVHLW